MNKKPEPPSLRDYEEAAVPFDDVMRQLLQAKPKPKDAAKPKARAKKTKKPSKKG